MVRKISNYPSEQPWADRPSPGYAKVLWSSPSSEMPEMGAVKLCSPSPEPLALLQATH